MRVRKGYNYGSGVRPGCPSAMNSRARLARDVSLSLSIAEAGKRSREPRALTLDEFRARVMAAKG